MWKLYKYNKDRKENELIDSDFEDLPQDCWGDDTGIAVMAINPENDDFYLAWE